MNRYAIITHLDSSQRFAILVENADDIDTIGVSAQGKEWEAWADALPPKNRRRLEQLLTTVGPQFSIEGPAKLSKTQREEFATFADANQKRTDDPAT